MKCCSAMVLCLWFFSGVTVASDIGFVSANSPRAQDVRFAQGSNSITLKGRVTGYQSVDYRLDACAGQSLSLQISSQGSATYFNVLPPKSNNVAMFIGGYAGNPYSGILPLDGTYTVRLYLNRAAARRNASGSFTLTAILKGMPLIPLVDRVDAYVAGTHYHASGSIKCERAYSQVNNCDALVVRRTPSGSGTVEVRWDNGGKRAVLFIDSVPAASDSPRSFSTSRNEKGFFVILFDDGERLEIPDALVFGG